MTTTPDHALDPPIPAGLKAWHGPARVRLHSTRHGVVITAPTAQLPAVATALAAADWTAPWTPDHAAAVAAAERAAVSNGLGRWEAWTAPPPPTTPSTTPPPDPAGAFEAPAPGADPLVDAFADLVRAIRAAEQGRAWARSVEGLPVHIHPAAPDGAVLLVETRHAAPVVTIEGPAAPVVRQLLSVLAKLDAAGASAGLREAGEAFKAWASAGCPGAGGGE